MTSDSIDNILARLNAEPEPVQDPPAGLLRIPEIEIVEESDALVVMADIVGVEREDIRVDVSPQRVVIAATARDAVARRPTGVYQRSFTLPSEIRPEEAEAHYNNGTLEIFLPKKQVGGTGVFRPTL